jgi:hypothetical protein
MGYLDPSLDGGGQHRLTSGAPPTIRVRGSLVPLEGYPNMTPTDTREIVYAILKHRALDIERNAENAREQIPGSSREDADRSLRSPRRRAGQTVNVQRFYAAPMVTGRALDCF